jgi:hypothetical protein
MWYTYEAKFYTHIKNGWCYSNHDLLSTAGWNVCTHLRLHGVTLQNTATCVVVMYLIFQTSWFSWPFLMAHSEAKLKNTGCIQAEYPLSETWKPPKSETLCAPKWTQCCTDVQTFKHIQCSVWGCELNSMLSLGLWIKFNAQFGVVN